MPRELAADADKVLAQQTAVALKGRVTIDMLFFMRCFELCFHSLRDSEAFKLTRFWYRCLLLA